jgi:hypothetical protein
MTELIGWFVAIYLLVLVVRIMILRMEAQENFDKLKAEADRRIRIVDLQPLPEHNSLLAYDKENSQFLGQGITEEDVKLSIITRFPDKIFILHDKVFSALHRANAEIKFETSSTR